MVNADRQLIMETNRSLRNIKNELENLLEKGVIDESVFDTINSSLPEESPLSGPLRTTANRNATPNASSARATPADNNGPTALPQAMQNLNIASKSSPAPPSYEDTPPPGPPPRHNAKPVIAHARALYRYAGADARDVSLEKDDKVAVHEYMNQDWWMGQNLRTGQEGIFPRNYVFVEQETKAPAPAHMPVQPQYGYPGQHNGPPAQQNPYNSHVPPMAVAEGGQPSHDQQQGDSKVNEYGKKFGKKLGNAAIFGAGATLGGNLVNSIF